MALGICALDDLRAPERTHRGGAENAEGKEPQMNRERWKERESGVRGQEFADLKPQASSLLLPPPWDARGARGNPG